MSRLLDQFGAAVAGFFDHPLVRLGIQAVVLYVVVLWLAAAWWAYRDMRARTLHPALPFGAALVVILFSPLLFPLAIVAYRIARPQETISEAWERHQAEEAMRYELEATTCAGCGRRVDEDWLACPTCGTRLARRCLDCGRTVGLDWSLCAWCGRGFSAPHSAATELDRLVADAEWAPGAAVTAPMVIGPESLERQGREGAVRSASAETVAIPIFGGQRTRPSRSARRGPAVRRESAAGAEGATIAE